MSALPVIPDLERIVSDPAVLGGKPIVRGTRLSVEFLLELGATGADENKIVAAYPQLTLEDVRQAMRYAATTLGSETVRVRRIAG